MKIKDMPEPGNGVMLAAMEAGGIGHLVWRDDARTAHEGHPAQERWYDGSDDQPITWAEIVRFAETINLVNLTPIATR